MKEGWGLPKLGEIPGVPSAARSREKGGGRREMMAPTGVQTNGDFFFSLFSFVITLCGSEPSLKQADASSDTAAFPPRGALGPAGLGMLLC